MYIFNINSNKKILYSIFDEKQQKYELYFKSPHKKQYSKTYLGLSIGRNPSLGLGLPMAVLCLGWVVGWFKKNLG